MEIRILQQPELLPALHLVWEVYADAIAPSSTPEGVASFQKFIKYDYISQVWQRGELIFLGAYEAGTLCGTLALRPDGHIALFFVEKERQGQGIGRLLFQYAYQYCAEHLHTGRLTVNAAPEAVERYVHMGMRPISGEQEREGIRYIPMEMYVNLGMVTPKSHGAKTPWIALGVFGVVLVLMLTFIGVNAYREFRRGYGFGHDQTTGHMRNRIMIMTMTSTMIMIMDLAPRRFRMGTADMRIRRSYQESGQFLR